MSAAGTTSAVTKNHVSFCSTKLLGTWADVDRAADSSSAASKAFDDMQTFLAEMLRCEQLVVLGGLGTSLGVVGAPTMRKLWDACEKLGGKDFADFCNLCNYPLAEAKANNAQNIEQLLSTFLGTLEYGSLSDSDRKKIQTFTRSAEAAIVELTGFAAPTSDLTAHKLGAAGAAGYSMYQGSKNGGGPAGAASAFGYAAADFGVDTTLTAVLDPLIGIPASLLFNSLGGTKAVANSKFMQVNLCVATYAPPIMPDP